ncbi:MAG: hypothetical protein HY806_03360 [Nitrospirae bacterium]|nr:hypothetical protein [Nitrospirota bacterium]MBI4838174.1 hypothetical protein [Nitrospirota bacterium]
MTIAKKYFQKQLANADFRNSYLEEKVKLDIEYQLEELKKDIQTRKTIKELIKRVNSIEQYVMSA